MDLRTAARRLGVHYQTVYRWVRDGRLPAVKVGSAYLVEEADVVRLAAVRTQPVPPPRRAAVRAWQPLVERLTAALVDGDELGARQAVERLHTRGVGTLETLQHLLTPAMRAVGELWSGGRLSVCSEHRATAIAERLVARVTVHPRGRPRGVAVVATPPGEAHGLPAAMAAAVLRADRWRVHHLGTDVPEDGFGSFVADVDGRLAVVSVTLPRHAAVAGRLAEAARRSGARALVGGPGASLADLVSAARSSPPA